MELVYRPVEIIKEKKMRVDLNDEELRYIKMNAENDLKIYKQEIESAVEDVTKAGCLLKELMVSKAKAEGILGEIHRLYKTKDGDNE